MQAHLFGKYKQDARALPRLGARWTKLLPRCAPFVVLHFRLRVTFSAYNIILVVVSPYAPPVKPPGVLFALTANAFALWWGGSGLVRRAVCVDRKCACFVVG
jgi:hypothetical protein